MSKEIVVTEEVFSKAKHLLNTGLFSRKQISEMLNLNKSNISLIALYGSLEEMRAAQRASVALSNQRRKEREEEKAKREREAKEAYIKALNNPEDEPEEPEQSKRVPIGDCPNTMPEDSIELKADIIIEKLDTLIDLLKEVRVAQTSTSAGSSHTATSFYSSNKPF